MLNSVCNHFLNQARAGLRPACAWFLEIALVREVGMHVRVHVCVCLSVCLSAPEAINNYSREMKH